MKITRYAMMLAAATGLLRLKMLDEVKAYDPDKVVAPVLHALPGEIVITPDNMGSTQTFTWDAADFGVRTWINYSIEASYNDGAKLVLFTGMNGTSSEQTYESLNNILALSVEDGGLGFPWRTYRRGFLASAPRSAPTSRNSTSPPPPSA